MTSPLKLVSINLNKGLNGDRRTEFEAWLAPHRPAIVCLQEPVAHGAQLPERIGDYELAGGNHFVAVYGLPAGSLRCEVREERWLRCHSAGLVLDDVYFPYDGKNKRRDFFLRLSAAATDQRLIVGDFNMAPRAIDGRYGEEESPWTGSGERAAFEALLTTGLADLSAETPPDFTFRSKNKGKWTRFRCDLALASDALDARAIADHRVRNPTMGFTDHSALIVEVRG